MPVTKSEADAVWFDLAPKRMIRSSVSIKPPVCVCVCVCVFVCVCVYIVPVRMFMCSCALLSVLSPPCVCVCVRVYVCVCVYCACSYVRTSRIDFTPQPRDLSLLAFLFPLPRWDGERGASETRRDRCVCVCVCLCVCFCVFVFVCLCVCQTVADHGASRIAGRTWHVKVANRRQAELHLFLLGV